MTSQTVKQFVYDAYRLVSAHNPTTPLQQYDENDGISWLNDLVHGYSANGLMITISKYVTFDVSIGQQFITFGDPLYVPTPNVTNGRLANLETMWLSLQGVTYPLIIFDKNVFQESYKYFPQEGLPRYAIVYDNTDLTTVQIYPSASQVYTLNAYGKFELPDFVASGNMSALPRYYQRFLKFALAKDISMYKGRSDAWTQKLEDMLLAAKLDMQTASSINVVINTETDSYLNGKWRVIAGV